MQDPSLEFLVVYNHQQLLDEDSERLRRAAKVLGDAEVNFMVATLDAEIPLKSEKQITIIDEVDSVLIDSRCCPVKHYLTGRTRIIGLTATADNEMIKEERLVLKELDLEVYDSKIADNHKESEPLQPLTLDEFFHVSFDNYARLVFVHEDKLAVVEAICKERGLIYKKNCSKLSELRALKPKTVCAVTEGRLMRGFDYRSNNKQHGIALYMGRKVNCLRDQTQALTRVGRYGERCRRYAEPELFHDEDNLVDMDKRDELIRNATLAINRCKMKE